MSKATTTVEGWVAKDPETRQAGNHRITTVTVPVEQGRMKDGAWVADVDERGEKIVHWWEGEFWNDYGDAVASAIRKGALVELKGEPRPRAYPKKDGGVGIAETIVNGTVAEVVRRPSRQGGFGGGSPTQASSAQGQAAWGAPAASPGFSGSFDDEQPF